MRCRGPRARASRHWRGAVAPAAPSGITSRRRVWSPIRHSTRPTSPVMRAYATVDRDEPVRRDASIEAMAKLRPDRRRRNDHRRQRAGRERRRGGARAVVGRLRARRSERSRSPRSSIMPQSRGIRRTWRSSRRWRRRSCSTRRGCARPTSTSGRSTRPSRRSRSRRRHGSGSIRRRSTCAAGAVAMGHPIGASGARIVAAVVQQLRKRGGGLGIAAICSGGGQGDAVLVRVA